MAVKIIFDKYCKNCKYAELDLDYRYNCDGEKIWFLRCTHDNVCFEHYLEMKRRNLEIDEEF